MSTTLNTIFSDMKTSLKQAYGSTLSYFLANLGMIIVMLILVIAFAIPVAIVAFIALAPLTEATWTAMSAWAAANPLAIGSIGILVLIPVVALFLVVSGAIYGMSHELVTTGETKAETAFSYLKRKFLTFFGTGVILTIFVVLPPTIVWGLTSYAMGYVITSPISTLLTIFTFVWVFITAGLTSLVWPAVVSGKSVQEAFKESYSLSIRYFDRVFGVLTAIVLLLAATFGPMIIVALGMIQFVPPITMMSPILPAMLVIALWTVISVFLWLLLFLPMVRIAWTRIYQELSGGKIASQIPVEVPIV
ncbi:hypothetical protein E4H12_03580 [Candidatus Thorarchaeota archaeon]|nr:MAG: hypothetical protein E4H12_03580 [Candidatus Thorarchaeota archaeon]